MNAKYNLVKSLKSLKDYAMPKVTDRMSIKTLDVEIAAPSTSGQVVLASETDRRCQNNESQYVF